jgi:radial spoke head protein 4/6
MILMKSLKALVVKTNATNLRFWGKIRGTEQDYFVAEVTADAVAADEDEAGIEGVEKHGEGVNALTYFVTNAPETGNWTALPDLKPEHLQCARETQYAFSGHLDRKVFTNPFIHFQEKFLLRAAISRITSTTNIQPVGVQRLQEESEFDLTDNVPEDGEGPVPIPTTSQMKQRNMWCHSNRNILKCNRITHVELAAPEEEGVEMEDLVKAQRSKDPYEARLKPISLDTAVQGGMPAWVIRHHGDAKEYTSANPLHPN